ncbi:DUF3050 domain-containing protein [Flavobacterium sp. CS20]|jgi:hypothetical protein|uniref:DUF3050 domain-containing protein n=1 Tax=Flavobacterium sp. CS20 TaxID=2775246 RepID=UPI001B39F40B|nr:DUF3050 domain-containing protein [Flavobacterium sp. CS20]QTY26864.1 DUF3050 domain-containing protein [Flavobacterium sp. CS20]
MSIHLQKLIENLKPLRQKLLDHNLYRYIETPDDLRIFTQHHVFAVWDFMSLLKILQQKLTNVNVPWTPSDNTEFTYLINDIVLAEESDLNRAGKHQSHYEMYLDAMENLTASTLQIRKFTDQIQHGTDIFLVISTTDLPKSVKSFLIFTFNTIYHKQTHDIVSAFTFGREELIPDMFTEIIAYIQKQFPDEKIDDLKYYFERHIEIDADQHGPMAIKLIENLCQNDINKWQSVEKTAEIALQKRIELWDGILKSILNHKAIA